MKLDAFRFSIGPWKGRYSSVWRIWYSKKHSDVYLAVRSLSKYLKVSLHQSGKWRIGFTNYYNQKLTEDGRSNITDRAFLKWEKNPVLDNQIMQALDIHFPLVALSHDEMPATNKGKTFFFIGIDEKSLSDNDSITVKILFHRILPESRAFLMALHKNAMMPVFYIDLENGEFVTIAFQYSKRLPIIMNKGEDRKYAEMLHSAFIRDGMGVGSSLSNLTLQLIDMGSPPSITNVGGLSVHWVSEKHFSLRVDTLNA